MVSWHVRKEGDEAYNLDNFTISKYFPPLNKSTWVRNHDIAARLITHYSNSIRIRVESFLQLLTLSRNVTYRSRKDLEVDQSWRKTRLDQNQTLSVGFTAPVGCSRDDIFDR